MSVKVNLSQFKREYEAAHRRDITWAEIREATGISDSTLSRLMKERSERVDLDVLDRLCKFFGVSEGPIPFLLFEPDDEESASAR